MVKGHFISSPPRGTSIVPSIHVRSLAPRRHLRLVRQNGMRFPTQPSSFRGPFRIRAPASGAVWKWKPWVAVAKEGPLRSPSQRISMQGWAARRCCNGGFPRPAMALAAPAAQISERLPLLDTEAATKKRYLEDLCNGMAEVKKPLLAAVEGAALGGGFELALMEAQSMGLVAELSQPGTVLDDAVKFANMLAQKSRASLSLAKEAICQVMGINIHDSKSNSPSNKALLSGWLGPNVHFKTQPLTVCPSAQ
ncbi:hypothetical protein CHGG_01981 [Chaetomium globosum CBS 148.51]|uniref:Enoyl-CoA hydratase n=1 Tax=Chaetomium globosum (strain ATCC 6205 / CBS 148.51 / DSM 1962 / NBRC 6347 / NRRL 1970) TaxID=306901 RepID=Q2HCS3_CHAGB|nr:uncharacterized protein CHGG_01981 [Chaetomium globosum CBS 148.51]EAQ93746.1 hypothetical protein CHGG_01981 [Chaetomium globosum CBS 148.51]